MGIYTDADLIYEAGTRAMEGAPWKHATHLFEMNHLLETAKIQKLMEERSYVPDCGKTFVIRERGKRRVVTSIPCPDKTVNHVLCDNVLSPFLDPYLIHDNGASRKGKGVAFHRRRFEQHMHEFYRKHGNQGFILLGDFKGYYASIDAALATEMLVSLLDKSGKLSPEDLDQTEWLLKVILGDGIGINIGGQPSQNVGITFAHCIDNYVKTVKSQRFYGRYSDDFYCISESKEFLEKLSEEITEEAKKYKLVVHPNKTHIARLDQPFKHLQISYRLTGTGKLVKRINPEAVTRERHRIKAYKRLLGAGRMSEEEIENAFKSWMVLNYKVMSRKQIQGIYEVYKELFGKEITWKTSRLRYLTAQSSKTWSSTETIS